MKYATETENTAFYTPGIAGGASRRGAALLATMMNELPGIHE